MRRTTKHIDEDKDLVIAVTGCRDGLAHYVDDITLGRCVASGERALTAKCGDHITMAPLAVPLGPPCPHCAETLAKGRRR